MRLPLKLVIDIGTALQADMLLPSLMKRQSCCYNCWTTHALGGLRGCPARTQAHNNDRQLGTLGLRPIRGCTCKQAFDWPMQTNRRMFQHSFPFICRQLLALNREWIWLNVIIRAARLLLHVGPPASDRPVHVFPDGRGVLNTFGTHSSAF